MNRLRNHSLSFQIWLVISVITLLISGLLVIILPHTLRDFFTQETYKTIEASQDLISSSSLYQGDRPRPGSLPDFANPFGDEELDSSQINPDFHMDQREGEKTRQVRHFYILADGSISSREILPMDFLNQALAEALRQKETSKKYALDLEGQKVFYIISKGSLELGRENPIKLGEAYLVSYLGDSYREDLVRTLFRKLARLSLLILLLSWIPALLLARYLSQPLVDLERRVENLTNRQWQEEINLRRGDEIGKLGQSVEKLRLELIRQDQAEQNFIQNISHELKTPTMIIRSYVEAIADGIFPEGSLESSLEIIDQETLRLEEKIQSLLYITKLDYLSSQDLQLRDFYLDDLVGATLKKLALRRPDLDYRLDLEPVLIRADRDQIQIALENILDNALRYARTCLMIQLGQEGEKILLKFYNDGTIINSEDLETIFQKFHKGRDGEIGLGLSIVKRIMDIHNYKIFAKNEDNGVSFYIEIKKE